MIKNVYLVGDIHLNYRSLFIQQNLNVFDEHYNKTFTAICNQINSIKEKSKNLLVFLGDISEPFPIKFDFLNFFKMFSVITSYIHEGGKVYVFVGNHDIYMRSYEKSVVSLLIKLIKDNLPENLKNNIILIKPDDLISFKVKDIQFIFLGVEKKFAEIKNLIGKPKPKPKRVLVFSHKDFVFDDTIIDLKVPVKVFTGHLHNPENRKISRKVIYVGSISQFNFRDAYVINDLKSLKKIDKFKYGFAKYNISKNIFTFLNKHNFIFVQIKVNNMKDFLDSIKIMKKKKDNRYAVEFIIPESLYNELIRENLDKVVENSNITNYRFKVEFPQVSEIQEEKSIDINSFEKQEIENFIKEKIISFINEINKETDENLISEIIKNII